MSFFNVPPERAHKSRHVAVEAAGIQINQGLGLPLLSSIVSARDEGKSIHIFRARGGLRWRREKTHFAHSGQKALQSSV